MTFNGWKEVTLGEISLDGKGSYGIAASAVEYSDDLYTYLRITDINDDGTLNKTDLKSVDDEKAEKYLLQPNDIVFARTGNSTGRSYFYDGSDGELVYAGFLIKFSLDPSKVNPKFMRYYTLSNEYKGWVSSYISGSTRGNINAKTYANMKISLPPRKQQDYLVKVLSSLDEKIKTNNQINEKLEEMAQALFKHWFVDFEFPNENGEPYKSSGGEMVESELGMIPKGWEVGKLGELVEISNKSIKPQEYPEKFFEYYSIPAFDNGKTPEFQKGKEIKSNKYVINNHVVLVSKLNPSTKRIWKPITQTKNAICSTEFIVYMSKKGNILSYVFEYLNNEKFQGVLTANATGSTGSRQRVKPKETLNYKVVLPPLKLMQQFSRMIEPMHLEIGSNMIENQKIKGLRDILLPKLMSGEIRVPLDDEVLSGQS